MCLPMRMTLVWFRLVVGSAAVAWAAAAEATEGGHQKPDLSTTPRGATETPMLLPSVIESQEPVFFPKRASRWALRDARQTSRNETFSPWDDVAVADQDGFHMPVVPPLQPLSHPSLPAYDAPLRFRDILPDLWDVEDPTKDTGGYWDSQDHNGDPRKGVSGTQGVVSQALPVMCGTYHIPGGASLTLQTPYYPSRYNNRFRCRWTITTSSEQATMTVHCNTFSLGTGDALTLAYKPGKPRRYQWRKGPVNQTLHTAIVTLVFSSNRYKNSLGFSCTITALGPVTTTSAPTTTTTEATNTTATTTTPTTVTTTTTEKSPVGKTTRPAITTTTSPTSTTRSTSSTALDTTSSTTGLPLSHPDCGISETTNRIVNGNVASAHKFPWQALLTTEWSDGQKQLCGGSLVNTQWVLTAAHCVLRKKKGSGKLWLPTVKVKLGLHRINDPGKVSVTAAAVNIHPKNSFSHDVALIKLPSAVSLDSRVRPVCLPPRSMLHYNVTGVRLTSSGWGKTETGKVSLELRELSQLGIESGICKKVFGKYITGHHFCTSGVGVKHICLGDSGGPVMREVESRMVLMGVVSFVATKNCTLEYPDGHTSVVHFLDWIWDTIGHPAA